MDQQSFDDPAAEPASSVLFEDATTSVLFEAGAMDDSLDTTASDDPFAESTSTPVDIYTDDSEASTIEIMFGRPAGTGLPRSFASSMLERCDDGENRGSVIPGFRKDEETPLATKVEVLSEDCVQQSGIFVAEPTAKTPMTAMQVAVTIYLFIYNQICRILHTKRFCRR